MGAFADAVPCAASTLSHHLKEPERARIIERARNGRQLLCRLNVTGREGVKPCIEEHLLPDLDGRDSSV